MLGLNPFHRTPSFLLATVFAQPIGQKKADVAKHPEVFHHVGLLVNGPPGGTGLPFKQSSDHLAEAPQRCPPEPSWCSVLYALQPGLQWSFVQYL
jgi:hypothetical protein